MPISRFLSETKYTPDQRRLLEKAFEAALRKLNLVDRGDPICEIVAEKVIEIGSSGLMSPAVISEIAAEQLDPR